MLNRDGEGIGEGDLSGAHNLERATSTYSCHGVFTDHFISHKPVSKTYTPENDNLFLFNDVTFSFMISYISIAFIDVAEIPFSREKLP